VLKRWRFFDILIFKRDMSAFLICDISPHTHILMFETSKKSPKNNFLTYEFDNRSIHSNIKTIKTRKRTFSMSYVCKTETKNASVASSP